MATTPQPAEPKRKVLVAPSTPNNNKRNLALAGIAAIISVGAHALLIVLLLNLDLKLANATPGDVVIDSIIDDGNDTTRVKDQVIKPADRDFEPFIDLSRPDLGLGKPMEPTYEVPKLNDDSTPPLTPMPNPGFETTNIPETPATPLPPPPGPGIGIGPDGRVSPDGTARFFPQLPNPGGPGVPGTNPFLVTRRDPTARNELLEKGGGNKESEATVAKGLIFLSNHQARDGHWSLHEFDRHARKQVKNAKGEVSYIYETDKSDPKTSRQNDIAGTAFGLLPFLAAGHTQNPVKDAKFDYSKNVKAGLFYLIKQQDKNKDGYYGGDMYAHALATIAMCEAYGLTADNTLKISAQKAIQYIEGAQGVGGGWRYGPKADPGDTSVTGWQLMALKSGQMAGLSVKAETLKKVEKFLDSCESANKGGYSYTPGSGETVPMTAVGLLCRQYLGANPRNPDLLKGMQRLEASPPSHNHNIYYLYYATQVMHHMGGENWKAWNLGPNGDGKGGIRDTLITLMDKGATNPDTEGSWMLPGSDGRLMSTSLALLTLEVYYRHLPLYRRDVDKVKGAP